MGARPPIWGPTYSSVAQRAISAVSTTPARSGLTPTSRTKRSSSRKRTFGGKRLAGPVSPIKCDGQGSGSSQLPDNAAATVRIITAEESPGET